MSVLFARIDDRLIHGQILESWLPFLNTNEILVVSDAVVSDETRMDLMKISIPEHVRLKIKTVSDAVKYLKKIKEEKKILLITPSPCEILLLMDAGVRFDIVNVGGMHYSIGKIQIGRAVFIDEKDIRCLKKIASKGVRLEGRGVPTDKPIDVLSKLEQ